MDDSRLLKAVFFDFKKGKRKSGGQFLKNRNVYKHHLFVDSWERQMGKSEARVTLLNQEAFLHVTKFGESLEDLHTKRLVKKNRSKTFPYTYFVSIVL